MSLAGLWSALRKGVFPHQISWFLDNPLRRLILSPQRLADRLPIASSSHILEVGPGSGFFSVERARRVPQGRLALFDLQPEMIAKALAKFAPAAPAQVAGFTGDASRHCHPQMRAST